MRPRPWQPPQEVAPLEQQIVRRMRRAKLFIFLRQQRHRLFETAFQEELAAWYAPSAEGHPPIAPAQVVLATVLQADTGVSDDEVIAALEMDRRGQLVLDGVDYAYPPVSKGTLGALRTRRIAAALDRRLIERTGESAAQTKGFRSRRRAALDSSPLWGAGRVEDTVHLLGQALRKAVALLAQQQGRDRAAVAEEAAAALVRQSSLKAALDCAWDDPAALPGALRQVLPALAAVAVYVAQQPPTPPLPAAQAQVAVAQEGVAQDVEQRPDGTLALRTGVAEDRRISVDDPAMRHGRKSRRQLIDGDKRHVVRDLDSTLIPAVGLTRAAAPEATVTDAIGDGDDLAHQDRTLCEWPIDRAYLSSALVRERPAEVQIFCKAWPVRSGPYFATTAFAVDGERCVLRCPPGHEMPFEPGGTVHFPAQTCATCPLRADCTPSARGRSVTIHPDEQLLQELRERQTTPAGRARLRERVAVEHSLAHVGAWQGDRARYVGLRKTLFDLRRVAVVHNLPVLARLPDVPQDTRAA